MEPRVVMAAGCVGVPFLTCNTTALIVEMTSCVCLLCYC